ncbi:hypothetical protein Tco_0959884 [Tanacetum coccineum]
MVLPTSVVKNDLKTLKEMTSYVMIVTSKLLTYFFSDCLLTSTLSTTTVKLQRKYRIASKNLRKPGESIHSCYLRYAKLINDMNMIPMSITPMQINTKSVNHLQPEWSRFVTTAKKARDLHGVTFDQL